MSEIVNLKIRTPPLGSILIDRSTKWGNPFHIGKDGDRATVIAKFEQKLVEDMISGAVPLADLASLYGKTLVCWCAPRPCHGDVLKKYAQIAYEIMQEDLDKQNE